MKKASEQQRHVHPEDHHLVPREDAPTSMPLPNGADTNGISYEYSPGGTRRNRKGSLSDKISVETLAQREPSETFKEATDEINKEIQIRRRNVPQGNGEGDNQGAS